MIGVWMLYIGCMILYAWGLVKETFERGDRGVGLLYALVVLEEKWGV